MGRNRIRPAYWLGNRLDNLERPLKRLGWFMRLCIIATLWWLPISTLHFFSDQYESLNKIALESDRICRIGWPGESAAVEIKRIEDCQRSYEASIREMSNDRGHLLRDSFGLSVVLAAIGWAMAWAFYWSIRFVLGNRRRKESAE